jgi:DNA gyrase/topoisomerase IV subunit A
MQRSIVGYFINFLKELLQSEKTLQALRKELSSIKKYHPLCIFQKIAGRKEQITIRMMNDYLKDRVACNEREVYEIFEKFDHQRLGVIERADFCREVHSKGKKMEKFREGISITHEIEAKFINYLTTIVKSGRVLDVWRKELLSIEPYAIFKALDSNLDGVIGPL